MKQLMTLQYLIFELEHDDRVDQKMIRELLEKNLEKVVDSVKKAYPNFKKPAAEEIEELKAKLKGMTKKEFETLAIMNGAQNWKSMGVTRVQMMEAQKVFTNIFEGDDTSEAEVKAILKTKEMIEKRELEKQKVEAGKKKAPLSPNDTRNAMTMKPGDEKK